MKNVALQKLGLGGERGEISGLQAVTPDLALLQLSIVNVLFHGRPGAGDRKWVLIDTGLTTSAPRIIRAASEWFGVGARPSCIVLTHGHFDHVGSLRELAEMWDVPVYAHPLEMPYLTGRSDYPPPDPTVGGGAMAYLSRFYPRKGIDLGGRVQALPADGSVPDMPGWRWIHTPGHTPGHVALFRDSDRALIAGDAFVTQVQESATGVLTRRPVVHRPPAYFTTDWWAARRSVEELAALQPEVAATGHGIPMHGEVLRRQLDELAMSFDDAVPAHGRYVRHPALADETGVVALPPPVPDRMPAALFALGVLAVAGFALSRRRHAVVHTGSDVW
ncbi:MAG TPA: MBL fold metallo-hydrolase [Thermoanaerobaculia bacterium]|nr:MBL fold metallo-hydrolase [Thermoanaerobaculia bacterium]